MSENRRGEGWLTVYLTLSLVAPSCSIPQCVECVPSLGPSSWTLMQLCWQLITTVRKSEVTNRPSALWSYNDAYWQEVRILHCSIRASATGKARRPTIDVRIVRIANDSCSIKNNIKKFWPTKSDRCSFFTMLDGAMLCYMNQWSTSVQSSVWREWRPTKLSPFARPIPSVRPCICPCQVGALRKRWEIGLWLLWGVDRKSTVAHSGTPSSVPRPPLSLNWGLTTRS